MRHRRPGPYRSQASSKRQKEDGELWPKSCVCCYYRVLVLLPHAHGWTSGCLQVLSVVTGTFVGPGLSSLCVHAFIHSLIHLQRSFKRRPDCKSQSLERGKETQKPASATDRPGLSPCAGQSLCTPSPGRGCAGWHFDRGRELKVRLSGWAWTGWSELWGDAWLPASPAPLCALLE